jgi:prolyl-tRNA synthetase
VALPGSGDALDNLLATARAVLQSYRQLPVWLYRVAPVAKEDTAGSGLFGSQGGRALDLYCLHLGSDESATTYLQVMAVVGGVVAACGLEGWIVEAADAPGGAPALAAHAAVLPLSVGALAVLHCPTCGYAASQEAARSGRAALAAEPPLPIEPVETPDCKTIADLARFLQIPAARTAKAVFLTAEPGQKGGQLIFAVVRGDTDLNETKLRRVLGARSLAPASSEAIRAAGAEPGYGSPVGLNGVTVIVDGLAAASPNLVAGANRLGYHLRNVNYPRDYSANEVADIALTQVGDPCPACGTPLATVAAAELARVSRVGNGPAQAANLTVLDADGRPAPVSLVQARIYLDRLLGAVAEAHHDARGLIWPAAVTPYDVYLMTAGKALPEVLAAAERLYEELTLAGFTVLYDDRDERAGVKFNDADLLGLPARIVVGERGLREGVVEVKLRSAAGAMPVSLADMSARLTEMLRSSRPAPES